MVEVRFAFQMTTQVLPLNASAPYPLEGVPAEVGRFTGASPWVQPREVAAAVAQVVRGAGSAVQALVDVAAWLRSRCRYQPETNMESSHQVWQQGFGGMVGLTHLWIAALRGAGIPARAVVGVDASGDISVAAPAETLPRAPGLSVWLEAWLPEHGWVALDPRGMVGFLLPGRIPLVAAEDVPAALEGAAVRWRHVAGVAVSPRWGLEATVSALPLVSLNVAHRQPAPNTLWLPAVEPRHRPLAPRQQLAAPAPALCPPAFALELPGRYGPGQAIHAEAMEAFPRIFVRLEHALTDRRRAVAQPVEGPLRAGAVELPLRRLRGGGQVWVEIAADADGAPGKTVAVSRPVAGSSLGPQMRWIRFPVPSLDLGPGRYWIVPQFSGNLHALWLLSPLTTPQGPVLEWDSVHSGSPATRLHGQGVVRLCP